MTQNRKHKSKVMTQSSRRFRVASRSCHALTILRATAFSPTGHGLDAVGMSRRSRVPNLERGVDALGMKRPPIVPGTKWRRVGDAAAKLRSDTHHRQQPKPLGSSLGMAESRAIQGETISQALRRKRVRLRSKQARRFDMHRTHVLGWTRVRIREAASCCDPRGGRPAQHCCKVRHSVLTNSEDTSSRRRKSATRQGRPRQTLLEHRTARVPESRLAGACALPMRNGGFAPPLNLASPFFSRGNRPRNAMTAECSLRIVAPPNLHQRLGPMRYSTKPYGTGPPTGLGGVAAILFAQGRSLPGVRHQHSPLIRGKPTRTESKKRHGAYSLTIDLGAPFGTSLREARDVARHHAAHC
jgi:hypothetical protein